MISRLLDDNRELYVPELREAVRPHPHFMLFATQNPAGGAYAGRRPLSRAFRSRFLVQHSILEVAAFVCQIWGGSSEIGLHFRQDVTIC